MGEWVKVTGAGALDGEGPTAAEAGGHDLVLVRTAAGLRAFEGLCPHRGALLAEGDIEGGELVCRNHRWRFDAQTGARNGGPECLRACPLRETGGVLEADVSALAAGERARAKRRIADLPRPRGLPLVGNMFQIDLPKLHLQLEAWSRELGSIYRFRLGPRVFVTVADAELAEIALRARPDTWRRVSNVEPIFREMGVDGVFSAEGAAWRPQRRLAMEALAQRNLKSFYPTLRMVAERLRRRWERSAAAGKTVDILEDMRRFTIDVTTQLAFGHDVNAVERDDDEIQRRLELILPTFSRRLNATIPLWRLIRGPADRAVDRALGELRAWLTGIIGETRARLAAAPGARPENFLEAMLTARDEHGQPFSEEVVFGNAMTMLLAGEDTTANTLAWAVHHLAESPAAVTGLRAELDRVLGADGTPADLEVANRLAYALGVANEAMRLRPVAPLIFLEPVVDTTLGDLDVPRGTQVVFLVRPQATDAGNFADPTVFRPERWLPGASGAHESSAHIPFGSGPRICPGRSLALLEMRVVLATLYKSFDVVSAREGAEVREIFAFTMTPDAIPVRLARRAAAVQAPRVASG